MVASYDFYPIDPTDWVPNIAFSRVVVKWNVIFFNLGLFSYETSEFQKMSDWNVLISIAGKWKFYRNYWQWILKKQTSLYMVVYRTSLYNPTSIKVPKRHSAEYVLFFWNLFSVQFTNVSITCSCMPFNAPSNWKSCAATGKSQLEKKYVWCKQCPLGYSTN